MSFNIHLKWLLLLNTISWQEMFVSRWIETNDDNCIKFAIHIHEVDLPD